MTPPAATPPAMNLEQLRAERDNALQRTKYHLERAKSRVGEIDTDVQAFTRQHPVLAIGGAVAIGLGAGFLVGGQSFRLLLKAAGLMVLRPVAEDLSAQLINMIHGGGD